MSIRIGHASIDENGAATGGTGGDQTGKEVCTRNWYSKGWNVLLRPKSAAVAEQSAKACEAACANPNIGYDQGGRNTLYKNAKAANFDLSKITASSECDCSSLMHVCAIAGGADLSYGSNGCTTRTMVAAFVNSGDYEKLTDGKYLTSDKHLKRGDILVKEGSHTVMVLDDGSEALPDQTVHTAQKPEAVRVYYAVRLPLIVKGMEGADVKAMQQLLIANDCGLPEHLDDGTFDSETENALLKFQKKNGLKADGKCGQATWSALLGVKGVG